MAWKKLTVDDLKAILQQDEIDSLNTLSLDPAKQNIINDCIDMISDTWRGALSAKDVRLDIRDHFTPSEYTYWILVHARFAVWTRFNMSPVVGLDEARTKEYEKALSLLKDPYIGTTKPEWQYDPENPANGGSGQGSITVPYLRFDEGLWRWSASRY